MLQSTYVHSYSHDYPPCLLFHKKFWSSHPSLSKEIPRPTYKDCFTTNLKHNPGWLQMPMIASQKSHLLAVNKAMRSWDGRQVSNIGPQRFIRQLEGVLDPPRGLLGHLPCNTKKVLDRIQLLWSTRSGDLVTDRAWNTIDEILTGDIWKHMEISKTEPDVTTVQHSLFLRPARQSV